MKDKTIEIKKINPEDILCGWWNEHYDECCFEGEFPEGIDEDFVWSEDCSPECPLYMQMPIVI